jgi:hypothetical protein
MTRTSKANNPTKKKARPGVTKKTRTASKDAHAQRHKKALEVLCLMADEGLSTNKSLAAVGMLWGTFCRWCGDDPANAEMYVRAREVLLERMAHEIHDIADTPVEGVTTTVKPGGVIEERRGDMIEHRRLQIESRKWLLAKLMPRKYGDKQQIEHSGRVGLEALVAGDE